jgi:transglutaminase-like putative cysteine protease
MRLLVSHLTRYRYSPAIQASEHWAHLQPGHSATQQVLHHTLDIEPAPAHTERQTDAWGNTCLHWQLPMPHAHMQVLARSEVQTRTLDALVALAAWNGVADVPATLQPWCQASAHVPLDARFAELARPHFGTGQPLAQCAQALCAQVHRDFVYAPQSTGIDTSVHHVLATRQGVCQDFAHLLIAALRALGLAAAYVSGYLLTAPPAGQPRLVGADASHAWVRLWLPGLDGHPSGGWLHLDPTNNRHGWGSPGEDYVQLATGRDFSDVSPLRGTLQGHARQSLEVGVTVEPL